MDPKVDTTRYSLDPYMYTCRIAGCLYCQQPGCFPSRGIASWSCKATPLHRNLVSALPNASISNLYANKLSPTSAVHSADFNVRERTTRAYDGSNFA